MLAKQNRLTKKEFDQFFKSGKRLHSPLVQLIHAESDSFHGSVVVGKKVSKKAVRRNQLRRRVYSTVYAWHKSTNITGVFILILKPAAQTSTRSELSDAVVELLEKVAS